MAASAWPSIGLLAADGVEVFPALAVLERDAKVEPLAADDRRGVHLVAKLVGGDWLEFLRVYLKDECFAVEVGSLNAVSDHHR